MRWSMVSWHVARCSRCRRARGLVWLGVFVSCGEMRYGVLYSWDVVWWSRVMWWDEVWCGACCVVWCGVCRVVWCGVLVRYDMMWCGVMWFTREVWYDVVYLWSVRDGVGCTRVIWWDEVCRVVWSGVMYVFFEWYHMVSVDE